MVLEFWDVKPVCRKSWTLKCPNLTLGLSFQVKREEPNLKVLITHILLLAVWDVKPTNRNLWTRNLLMWSDLTSGASFKVKQGRLLIGFGDLSFHWIQFASVLRCTRYSSLYIHKDVVIFCLILCSINVRTSFIG